MNAQGLSTDTRPAILPTLLVLAAGMGSRYGGLKQLVPIGPQGETMLDYAVFDALRAGFGRVVFVIRSDFAAQFQAQVCAHYAGQIEVACVFQDLQDVPSGFLVPATRIKPWGTVHAVLAARALLQGAFAVINGDDFYGRDAYRRMVEFFSTMNNRATSPHPCAMVGYKIESTLSSNGGVNRGICVERDGVLVSVEEHTDIALESDGLCHGRNLRGQRVTVPRQAVCSMNFWGFTPSVLAPLAEGFARFLQQRGNDAQAECYIPTLVDQLVQQGQISCHILATDGDWFGVTYPQDRATCVAQIRALITRGAYHSPLWG